MNYKTLIPAIITATSLSTSTYAQENMQDILDKYSPEKFAELRACQGEVPLMVETLPKPNKENLAEVVQYMDLMFSELQSRCEQTRQYRLQEKVGEVFTVRENPQRTYDQRAPRQ